MVWIVSNSFVLARQIEGCHLQKISEKLLDLPYKEKILESSHHLQHFGSAHLTPQSTKETNMGIKDPLVSSPLMEKYDPLVPHLPI